MSDSGKFARKLTGVGKFNRVGLSRLALAAVLALAPAVADARLGGGSSSGSRGARTMSAPPSTATSPGAVQPMQRTLAPQTSPSLGARPQSAPAAGGFFGGGLGRGLLGGLLGAGLIGMLMGHGFLGGMGGLLSMLGLVLQVALLVIVGRLAWNYFAARRNPQPAAAGYGAARTMAGANPPQGGFGGFGGAAPQPVPAPVQTVPIQLQEADFATFERLLAASQKACSDEDLIALRNLSTEEMANYFRDDIEADKRKGVMSRISDVHLLQGDLSEAWREAADEYATVAMRFSLIDVQLDRNSGRVVDGDAQKPTEAREVWTFLRPAGGGVQDWKISAIQQA